MNADAARGRLRVLVVTPLGKGGMGGIDRIMDEVRPRVVQASYGMEVAFMASRGQGHIAMAPFLTAALVGRLLGRRLGFGPDLLHINLSSHGSALRKMAIARTATMVGAPYVIHLHGSGFRDYWDGASPFLAARIRSLFARAARIVVLGRVWRDYVASRAPEASNRIVILPNASPAPENRRPLTARDGEPAHILFLGHVGPRKGVPELVRALADLPSDRAWRATIAGNGEVEETRREVVRLGLSEKVSLPGWVGPDSVRQLLRDSDIVVLPSYEENLPMSVIEGMAYGRAVVATPVGAVEDVIEDGMTGLLVPVGDAVALSHRLKLLLDDPALRLSIGAAAAAFHGRQLDMDVYVERLKALWREAALVRA